jgi:hypothetical protein
MEQGENPFMAIVLMTRTSSCTIMAPDGWWTLAKFIV